MPAIPPNVVDQLREEIAAARQQSIEDDERLLNLTKMIHEVQQAAAQASITSRKRLESMLSLLAESSASTDSEDSSSEVPLVSAPVSAEETLSQLEVQPPEPPPPPQPAPLSSDEILRRLCLNHPRLRQHNELVTELKSLLKNAQVYAAPYAKTIDTSREKLKDIGNKILRQLHAGEAEDVVFAQYGPDAMNVLRDLRDVLYKIRQYPAHGTTAPSVTAFREPFSKLYERLWDYIGDCCPGSYEEFTFVAGKPLHAQKPSGIQEKAWEIVRTEARAGFAPNEVIDTLSPGYIRLTSSGSKELICPARVIVSPAVN